MALGFTAKDGVFIGGILAGAWAINRMIPDIPDIEAARLNPGSTDNYIYTGTNSLLFADENVDGKPDQTLGTWTYEQCHRPKFDGLPRPMLCTVLDWLAR